MIFFIIKHDEPHLSHITLCIGLFSKLTIMKSINQVNFKSICLGLSLLLMSVTNYSQTVTPQDKPNYKGFAMISLGVASPLGNLANQDVANQDAGLAKPGADVRISGGYLLHKNFGICGIYYGESFLMNAQAMAEYFAKMSPGVGYSVVINSGWGLGGMLLGGYGSLPLDKEKMFIFEPRFMVGYAVGQSPDYDVTAFKTTNGVTQSATVHQSRGSSQIVTSYLIGGGLKINLLKRLCLSGNVDYLGLSSKTKYQDVIIKDNVGNTTTTSFDMSMQSLSVTFGVGLRFGN